MLNNYKLGIEFNPDNKKFEVSAVFDFVKIIHHENLIFYLNKNLNIKEIRLNGEEIKLNKKRLPSSSEFGNAIKYSYDEGKIEDFKDNKIEMKYGGFLEKLKYFDGCFILSMDDFWIPVFDGFPQFMYLLALYLPKDYTTILQGTLIQEDNKKTNKLTFWERDFMDFDIPVFITRQIISLESNETYSILSNKDLDKDKLEILVNNINMVLDVFQNKFGFKFSGHLKFIVVDGETSLSAKYYSLIEKKIIRDFDINLISRIIRTLLNITPGISDNSWLLFGLVNYYMYLFFEEVKGRQVSRNIIEDWRTFIFSMNSPESILNNRTGKHIDILLTKKAPYIFKMLEIRMGKQKFIEIISELLKTDTFYSLTTYEFIEYLNKYSKSSLENFVLQCLHEKEIPRIRINKHIMTEKGKFKFYGEIIQETSLPFEIPIIFDFELEDGSKERRIHLLKKFKERYAFVFSAKPVKFDYNRNSEILIQIRS